MRRPSAASANCWPSWTGASNRRKRILMRDSLDRWLTEQVIPNRAKGTAERHEGIISSIPSQNPRFVPGFALSEGRLAPSATILTQSHAEATSVTLTLGATAINANNPAVLPLPLNFRN